ncbi:MULTISPECIES: copper chaperone PCu(A)C [unclassified Marinobacterium]|mgnify:CR=1 FL=1|jgi:copper(I)-binding protein|uniref:copper chaperone PCu(A)C n=1 Tax=unclassified Marinobacterium TaxID=2644139 RepID=UPI0015688C5B|nr:MULTISPECIES: copper chaperone PCu(A)C [unclassified Marinobacterium]NRP09516.1 hypothetical protein [Marinobacterium sp. xm-g-48]NRP15945.1 hypothetical protein [Marinobacterium sp. xm-a-152]NRP35399.1 hypothetical protein [Marinobacterium sp. xm-d-579]NRP46304.1 hypothetical protein [Marinobacterium sp. xm-d-543]NRP58700.1 hypothetical protein [Marinobacterium sp. xm-d-564]
MKKLLIASLLTSTLAQAEVEISDARVRAVPPGQKMTGAFMDIKNSGADLQVVSAESSISKVVELHTHIKDGEVMRMRKIPAIDLPANSTTHLKPGGLHVMFIGLKEPLSIDQTIDLKLNFSDGTSQALEVPVKMIQKPGMKKEMKHDMQH